jgi:hypothetical protein
VYLTPYSTHVHDDLVSGEMGLLITPQSHRPAQYDPAEFEVWAADNGCYTLGDDFVLDEYLEWLDSFSYDARLSCLFATAPDVVGDWSATLERSRPVLAEIRRLGYPAAIVIQDGATVDSVPWDEIDAVFVGGSTEWKLGADAEAILTAANELGIWSHMGRVNSIKRMIEAARMGAYSVDGTLLVFGPAANRPRIVKATWSTYSLHGDVEIPAPAAHNPYADQWYDRELEAADAELTDDEGRHPMTATAKWSTERRYGDCPHDYPQCPKCRREDLGIYTGRRRYTVEARFKAISEDGTVAGWGSRMTTGVEFDGPLDCRRAVLEAIAKWTRLGYRLTPNDNRVYVIKTRKVSR